jgi:hypothetical protein
MKIKQILFGFFCLLAGSNLWGQLSNTTVNMNTSICGGVLDSTVVGQFTKSNTTCIGDGQTYLYYSFSPATSFQLGIAMKLKFETKNTAGSAFMSSSYKIYGPFSSTDDYVTLIGTNSAPVLETGASGTGWRMFTSNVLAEKLYIVEIITSNCDGRIQWTTMGVSLPCSDKRSCEGCLPKFQPAGKVFVVSAWVKEETGSGNGAINYTNSTLRVTSGLNVRNMTPVGQIIDGWQRIEDTITTNSIGNIKMECIVTSGTSYFDDIRVFPYDGTIITYVYDPATLRLAAELDERNYAKIYEYDEEGKLVRVKKETEKGIMTIQENRENSSTTEPGY